MKSYVLATKHVEVSHTAENVAQELKKVASEWKISNKITAVVSGNAANMRAGPYTADRVETIAMLCPHPKLGGY